MKISNILTDPLLSMLGKYTAEDRQTCVEVIQRIMALGMTARKLGLPFGDPQDLSALEEQAEAYGQPFLAQGIRLIADGVDSEIIRDILTTLILASCDLDTSEGRLRLLHYTIELEGLIGIQRGYNPRLIEEQAYAFLGVGFQRDA